MRARRPIVPGLIVVLFSTAAWAQKGKILEQNLASGEGYTVMRVWGSHLEMGQAQGQLLAREIVAGAAEVKQTVGAVYATLRAQMSVAVWAPAEIEQELDGIVDGVKTAQPTATIDKVDLKIVNTYGDWSYACRSHSAWGSFVGGTTKTLSTRRLDFSVPITLNTTRHHLLLARDPSDGSVRWVNLAWPGYVVSVTGVNEYGTLASLHDYQSSLAIGAHMPRTVAVRYALTAVRDLPLEKHLDTVFAELTKHTISTGTFINYYVPEGHGGVLTCPAGQKCSKLRKPQADYFNGEVLITTNDETDGHSTPAGGEFMESYYKAGGPKTITDHQALMGHSGMHLITVDYRRRGDMTLWAEGRVSTGVTPTIKVEWSQLFPAGAQPGTDGGQTASDGGQTPSDGGSGTDGGGDSDGCALTFSAAPGGLWGGVLLLALLALTVLGRRR